MVYWPTPSGQQFWDVCVRRYAKLFGNSMQLMLSEAFSAVFKHTQIQNFPMGGDTPSKTLPRPAYAWLKGIVASIYLTSFHNETWCKWDTRRQHASYREGSYVHNDDWKSFTSLIIINSDFFLLKNPKSMQICGGFQILYRV